MWEGPLVLEGEGEELVPSSQGLGGDGPLTGCWQGGFSLGPARVMGADLSSLLRSEYLLMLMPPSQEEEK